MRAPLLIVLLLAGCYAPPPQTDTGNPQYQADLDTCSSSVATGVDKRNAKTGLAWFAGGVTRWSAIDTGVNACMDQHGWGHTRPCTPDELRNGNKTPGLVVTATGIRCSDSPKRS